MTEVVTLQVRANRRQGVPFSALPSSRMRARAFARAGVARCCDNDVQLVNTVLMNPPVWAIRSPAIALQRIEGSYEHRPLREPAVERMEARPIGTQCLPSSAVAAMEDSVAYVRFQVTSSAASRPACAKKKCPPTVMPRWRVTVSVA